MVEHGPSDDDQQAKGVHSTPQCPRCGYALIGTVETWREQGACPLEGKCSECGLGFWWRDVLSTRFAQPSWCVEYGPAHAFPIRAIRTLRKMLQPWRFWRELLMSHEPQWKRLAVFVLILGPMLYVMFATAVGIATYKQVQSSGVQAPAWAIALERAAWPWANVQSLTVAYGSSLSPAERYHFRIPAAGWRAVRLGWQLDYELGRRDEIPRIAFSLLSMLLFCPIGFALLPISRRIAKVRWRHIARIALYSLIIAIIPLGLECYQEINSIDYRARGYVAAALLCLTVLLTWTWWSAATRNYLRIRHAWAVGLFVVVFAHVFQRLVFETIDFAIVLAK